MGTLMYSIKVLAFIPVNFFTIYGIQIGSAIEITLLSLGLGAKITLISKEKNMIQENALKEQKLLTETITKSEYALRASLSERETLLKEIHHRVKNNMQIVSSLLELQKLNLSKKSINEIIDESSLRIRSMALVHEKLYENSLLSKISVVSYVNDLCSYLIYNFYNGFKQITKEIHIDDKIFFGIDKMIPFGLILNELITNSLKHAFENTEECMICVDLYITGQSDLIFEYSDNGCGIKDMGNLGSLNSFGMVLITNLTKQLQGELKIQNNNGARFIFSFKDMEVIE
jgi:two-component sensor histidine kinase